MKSWTILYTPSTMFVGVFFYFFKGFIHFLFMDLYHIHKNTFKVFYIIFFIYVGIFQEWYCRIARFLWWHIAMAVDHCVFMLVSQHMGLGWLMSGWFCLCWVSVFFFPWFLLPLWILGECDRCPLLVSLSCSSGMFSENACWCWRLGSWDNGREVGG